MVGLEFFRKFNEMKYENKKEKVLFLRKLPKDKGWGGCENRLYHYFQNVDYLRNDIIFATTHDVISKRLLSKNIPVKVEDLPVSFARSFKRRFSEIFVYLKRVKPDKIIFVQGGFGDFSFADFLAGYLIAKGNIYSIEVLGTPEPEKKRSKEYFGFLKGIGFWWYKEMLGYAIQGHLCKRTLTASSEIKKRLVLWYKYPEKKVVPVFFGVDAGHFKKNDNVRMAMRKQLGIEGDKIVLVSTSRLSREKRIDRLIEACADKDLNKVFLLIVGEGEERERLEELVNEKEMTGRVMFLGFKEDITPYLLAGDIFVLPSDVEGLGQSLLQAMSAELICVATRNPGPNEIICNYKNGFLVNKCSHEINAKIKEILSLKDPDKDKIRQNARKTVLNKFNLKQRIFQALHLLELGSFRD